jgi:hypothetical protein
MFELTESDKKVAEETSIKQALLIHAACLNNHAHALAAHCECLALAANNSMFEKQGYDTPNGYHSFRGVLQKWGIINEKGEPLI